MTESIRTEAGRALSTRMVGNPTGWLDADIAAIEYEAAERLGEGIGEDTFRLRRTLAVVAGTHHHAAHSPATEFSACSAAICLAATSALIQQHRETT